MSIGTVHPAKRRAVTWRLAGVLAGASLIACASTLHGPSGPASERTRALHLLNRATYGARPQDVDQVMRLGINKWLDQQMKPAPPPPPVVAQQPAEQREQVIQTKLPTPATPEQARAQQLQQAQMLQRAVVVRAALGQPIGDVVQTKITRAITSERQLEEVMTDFWFNHFNVNYNKAQVRNVISDYEDNAIRKHVFGRFEDMLLATAQHPAMLVYLDNFQSTVAPPPQQQQFDANGNPRRLPPQRGGLNENYARELMELHTLGVDGGYTQQDVIEVARAFTGWGIMNRPASPPNQPVPPGAPARPGAPAGTIAVSGSIGGAAVVFGQGPGANIDFRFDEVRHDRGEKVVLGTTLPAGRGMEDGVDVIHMLVQHPSTAKFIAKKLVRHFVADDPPDALVDEIASVFRKTNGDLKEVTRALFTADEFYNPKYYRGKTKRPYEFIASALRVTSAQVQQNQALVTQLRALGHLPYSEPAPTGYPVTAENWMSAGAMMNRMRFAFDLAGGRVAGVQFQPQSFFGEIPTAPQSGGFRSAPNVAVRGSQNGPVKTAQSGDARLDGNTVRTPFEPGDINALTTTLLAQTLPGVPPDRLAALIAEDLAQQQGDRRAALSRALGLVLGSPEFQRY
jgi:uncharacterized protein (DUF1800 family)